MINLKSLGKKLYSKVTVHIILIGLAGFIIIMLGNMIDVNRRNYSSEKDKIISKYENVIKQKDSINNILKLQQIELLEKVDSLENVKTKIIQAYDKKIKSVYDASAVEHAEWLRATIEKLDSTEVK